MCPSGDKRDDTDGDFAMSICCYLLGLVASTVCRQNNNVVITSIALLTGRTYFMMHHWCSYSLIMVGCQNESSKCVNFSSSCGYHGYYRLVKSIISIWLHTSLVPSWIWWRETITSCRLTKHVPDPNQACVSSYVSLL